MANNNTYTWSFSSIDVYPKQDIYSDMVYCVRWRLKATDQSTSHSIDTFGAQDVPAYNPDSGSFVPFSQLTEEQVTNWVMNAMGEKYGQLTASLDASIDDMINPPTLHLPPPWTTPTPSPTTLPLPSFIPYPTPTQTPTIP